MRGGSILTFYSYKGGVGRTLALANVAYLLAQWGHRVLCVDWDLEAPGLHLYFAKWLPTEPFEGGVVELVAALGAGGDDEEGWQRFVAPVALPQARGTLDILPAGRFDEGYVARMQALDWSKLYAEQGLGERVEELRNAWKAEYDFVLIDSRTGVTDIGGICTIQLPDELVVLFTANQQSLDGVIEVARRAAEQRNKLPFDRAGVPCVPVPTRFDGRVQFELAKEWLDIFATRLEPLYREWAVAEIQPRQLLDLLRIPYVAYWSFGEKLPVFEEGTRDPESIGFAFETLAALLAHRLANTNVLLSNRDQYVKEALAGKKAFAQDVFLAYSRGDESLAHGLARALRDQGVRVKLDSGELTSGRDLFQEIQDAIGDSQHLLILGSKGAGKSNRVRLAADLGVKTLLGDGDNLRRIIPVLPEGVVLGDLPHSLQSFQALELRPDEGGDSVQSLANGVAKIVFTSKNDPLF